KILEGQILACQCFSEPEAGTDLGNLKSTLIPTDGGFILNGQKIWTSFAKYSQLGFALARITNSSDFTANPNTLDQRKIVFILVDFVNPRGQIKVSPIQQLSGEAEFCEIFFDNVFIPSDSLVGDETNGWKIALETLIIERILLTFARHTQTIRVIKKLVRLLERKRDDVISDAFLNYVSEFNLLRLTAYKHVLEYDRGKKISAESSIDKLLWSENFKKFAKLYYNLALVAGDSQDIQEARKVFLYSLGRTIAAGTSEIHSLTIAQRLLNLPKSY
ncbi:MAG: acyl-CoA dehydrogenase family protein, partial [Deltaproteobacteria bacterium]|nr:acyl-CoA dehydrogenase family protein [Deltaproteobacteria bacterium]